MALVNCLELNAEDIRHILGLILEEFPVKEIEVCLPEWTAALPADHRVIKSIYESLRTCASNVAKMGDVKKAFSQLEENEYIAGATLCFMDMGSGKARIRAALDESLYYTVISELTGFDLPDDEHLIAVLRELSEVNRKYRKIEEALEEVEKTGYGIVMPTNEELHLDEPEIVKQPGGFGLRLRACAPSIHMIKAEIETEINPIVGSEQQSEELAANIKKEIERDPLGIWETNMLGKSLYELASEGLNAKLAHMPEDARKKMSETLSRIINEGSNGLVCILV